jgi:N-acylglucosamine-6-phosphate 2-epimerase
MTSGPSSSTPHARGPMEQLRGGLVVSCQAQPGDPLYGPVFMAAMAAASVRGGAVGVRINGLDDIRAVREAVDVPVIGLWKDGSQVPYITPTLSHALAVAAAGADVIALDATQPVRRDGYSLTETITALHEQTECLVMADVATTTQGLAAQSAGADLVATTMAGYTPDRPLGNGPDLELLADMVAALTVPIIAEGRITTPEQAGRALDLGAFAVVVGGAITRPQAITERFSAVARKRIDGAADLDRQ